MPIPDPKLHVQQRLLEVNMIRTLIRTFVVVVMGVGALALVPVSAHAKEPSSAETAGNRMEKKGNAEERAADADKARAGRLEKKGKAMKSEGKDRDDKAVQA